jgi:hypothetical protein
VANKQSCNYSIWIRPGFTLYINKPRVFGQSVKITDLARYGTQYGTLNNTHAIYLKVHNINPFSILSAFLSFLYHFLSIVQEANFKKNDNGF